MASFISRREAQRAAAEKEIRSETAMMESAGVSGAIKLKNIANAWAIRGFGSDAVRYFLQSAQEYVKKGEKLFAERDYDTGTYQYNNAIAVCNDALRQMQDIESRDHVQKLIFKYMDERIMRLEDALKDADPEDKAATVFLNGELTILCVNNERLFGEHAWSRAKAYFERALEAMPGFIEEARAEISQLKSSDLADMAHMTMDMVYTLRSIANTASMFEPEKAQEYRLVAIEVCKYAISALEGQIEPVLKYLEGMDEEVRDQMIIRFMPDDPEILESFGITRRDRMRLFDENDPTSVPNRYMRYAILPDDGIFEHISWLHENVGDIEKELGNEDESTRHYSKAARVFDKAARIHLDKGLTDGEITDSDEAFSATMALEESIRLFNLAGRTNLALMQELKRTKILHDLEEGVNLWKL